MPLMNRLPAAAVATLLAALAGCTPPGAAPSPPVAPVATAPAEPPVPPPNPERNAYFGDLHVHTGYSTDAYLLMTRTTPDDAFRFAKGETVEYLGKPVRRKAPLDFLAVTDHAEYLGVVRSATAADGPLKDTRWGKWLAGGTAEGTALAYQELLRASGRAEAIPEFEDAALQKAAWDDYVSHAERHDRPGRFTAFIAFEWTSAPDNQNLHRNVIFRGAGPERPYSSKESSDPEMLWAYMERERQSGRTLLAIPHNGNASNGLMFDTSKTLAGAPLTREYLERRLRNEPLTEIMQTKGQSDTHPTLSPNDEFAAFELFESLIGVPRRAKFGTGSYVRQAYGTGQELASRFGVNPFKLGLVGGTDFHSGVSSTEEFAYPGSHGNQDNVPADVLAVKPSAAGESPVVLAAAGLTGIWAEENTRAALFDAMQRKETFGTSGVRIRVRFFGGWALPADLTSRPEWVKQAYATGVPMGADLPARPAGAKAPIFAIHAVKDPDSGNLDRVQVVKVSTKGGRSTERVFDALWSGDRRPDAKTGKVPDVGSTVDVGQATYTNTIGAVELIGTWTDPSFDAAAQATYYVRVLEIPTPRWSTRWAAAAKLPPPPNVPATLRERAWTSPIWYGAPGASSAPSEPSAPSEVRR
jgi:hypothetical protein